MADPQTLSQALSRNFLGHSPSWYKLTISVAARMTVTGFVAAMIRL